MQKLRALIDRRGVLLFSVIAIVACCAGSILLNRGARPDLLHTANMLGPAAKGVLQGKGLSLCSVTRAGIEGCEHSARMPVAPLTIAMLYMTFHQRTVAAAMCKAVLFLLPVLLAFELAWKSAGAHSSRARLWTLTAFTFAILLPPTLDMAGNLNFEEGYFYSWLLLAVSVLLFPEQLRLRPAYWTAVAFVSLTLTYLSKSSMLLVSAVLALLLTVWLARSLRRVRLAVVFALSFACVPLLWGLYQFHSGGRFTVGTSLDGINLYKGNNPYILEHYPPPEYSSLDPYDGRLFAGHRLAEEWATNDYSMASAKAYMLSHPAATLRVDLRKARFFFLSTSRSGGGTRHSSIVEDAFVLGMILFHLALLDAIGLSIFRLSTGHGEERFAALAFLASTLCVALPYVIGFALTRHATVLILPAVAYLCRQPGLKSQAARK